MTFAVVALVAFGSETVRADTLPIIDNLPTTYTPGTSFEFQLRVPALVDFTSYSLDLVFDTNVTNPQLTASGSPAATGYPFPSSAGFSSPASTQTGSQQVTLTISDSTSPGVTVTPGTNDALATITVTPDASLTGPIQLSIGPTSLFHYNTEDITYDAPTNIPAIEQATVGSPTPVPAPAGAVLFGFGGLLLSARVLRRRG
jgi:hypothetical protein